MNRKLVLVVFLIVSFMAAGLSAQTLSTMQKDLEKLSAERTKLEGKISAAEKELASTGEVQGKRLADMKKAEEDLAKARDIVGKLDKIRPDYSEELSRRRSELTKSFTGPDGWIPSDKRAVYEKAYNELPNSYTKQIWEQEMANLRTARSIAALRDKEIGAARKDLDKGRTTEDALTRQITALKKDLDRVNTAIDGKQKDIEEEKACLAERASKQQASKKEKEIEGKIRAANRLITDAAMDSMAVAIHKRLFGDFKAPGGAGGKPSAEEMGEAWGAMDNLRTLFETLRNSAGGARMGTQAASGMVEIGIKSIDIIWEMYGLVGSMYNLQTRMGMTRYEGGLQNTTSFEDAFDSIWVKMGAGKQMSSYVSEERARHKVDQYVRAMAKGTTSPAKFVRASNAKLRKAEGLLKEADELAKASPEPASPGGVPAVAKIEGYAVDYTDNSIGFWNSPYPNLSFDDEKGRKGLPNGQWKGSYYFKENKLYLVIDNLSAKYPPSHTLGIGYTVTLRNAAFEDGSTTKNLILYKYSGAPKDRRIIKSYNITTTGERCRKNK